MLIPRNQSRLISNYTAIEANVKFQFMLTIYLKSILDCSEANEGFYVKCGFKRAGLEMAHYYDKPRESKA